MRITFCFQEITRQISKKMNSLHRLAYYQLLIMTESEFEDMRLAYDKKLEECGRNLEEYIKDCDDKTRTKIMAEFRMIAMQPEDWKYQDLASTRRAMKKSIGHMLKVADLVLSSTESDDQCEKIKSFFEVLGKIKNKN